MPDEMMMCFYSVFDVFVYSFISNNVIINHLYLKTTNCNT